MVKAKWILWIGILVIAFSINFFPAYAQQKLQRHSGYQVSTLGALNVGVYEGTATIGELKEHGDFGLGTFEGLEGEMIALNGDFFQVKTDGMPIRVNKDARTPFASVVSFSKEKTLRMSGLMTYPELQGEIDRQLATRNMPQAIRIYGVFPSLKVRSVPKQVIPYPPLAKVVKEQQKIFELHNVRGTLVGFRMPQYMSRVNVMGYHFHFIASDFKTGGHLLDGQFLNAVAQTQALQDWLIGLPENSSFAAAALP
jgi:acetolactate decarboxylase